MENYLVFVYFQPHPTSEDIVIVQENEYCQSEKMPIFIGAIYAYKGLLLVRLFYRCEKESAIRAKIKASKMFMMKFY